MRATGRWLITAILLVATFGSRASAGVPDHLQCFKVKDPLKLVGVTDLDSPALGAAPGCKLSRAKLYCLPATSTPGLVLDSSTNLPIAQTLVQGPNPGARICYKAKCPAPYPPDATVRDIFGSRLLEHWRTSMVCTPAFAGTALLVDNGDGTVTDNSTGLQWEQKVAGSGCLHCVDDTYTWAAAMSEFISQVNGTSFPVQTGLGGHSDWRLPTAFELSRITAGPAPCAVPCINPVFGPTIAGFYWSSTTYESDGSLAWGEFFSSVPGPGLDFKTNAFPVRAVRGG